MSVDFIISLARTKNTPIRVLNSNTNTGTDEVEDEHHDSSEESDDEENRTFSINNSSSEREKLLKLVVSDTISYCKKCRSGVEEKDHDDDDDDDDKWNRRIVKGCLPHRVEIQGRLDFLRFVVQQTTIELSFERIKALYNVFCVDPVVTIEECHMFLSILSSCVRGFCLFLSFT